MLEPAQIAVEEGAQVVHPIFEHRQPVDTGAEGEALPFIGIEPAGLDHPPVHHAAAQHFHPAAAGRVAVAADHALAVLPGEADIDFGRRLGEGEIAGAQAQHDVVALEERLEEGLQRPLEVAERDALVDHQAFDLVEHRRVRGIRIRAIDAARRDDADRGLAARHGADLHGAGVRAQHHWPRVFAGEVEGIVHRARRMRLRNVERGEIMPVVLDFGAGGDREAQIREDLGEFVHHLADRVDRARCDAVNRQRHVHRFAGEARVERGLLQARFAGGQRLGDGFAQGMDARALFLALFGGELAERLEQAGDRALLAERLDAHRLQRIERGGGIDRGKQLAAQGIEIGGHRFPFTVRDGWNPRRAPRSRRLRDRYTRLPSSAAPKATNTPPVTRLNVRCRAAGASQAASERPPSA